MGGRRLGGEVRGVATHADAAVAERRAARPVLGDWPRQGRGSTGGAEGPLDPDRLPAQIVRPSEGRVEWILDREAASRLGSSF